ncbi:MAG: hypothetical protein JRM77_10095, partial [Nitrososphaerota archaeon]|nr:hypothetical protein [Nitrososphaerota archaeon]
LVTSEPGMLQRDSQDAQAIALFGSIPKFEPYSDYPSLYAEVRGFIERYLDLADDRGYDVFAAWIISTYLRDKWRAVPFLFFLGNPGTGKTRALEIAQALSFRVLLVNSISAPAVFRIDEEYHPTLCLDETEYLSREERSEIVGLLNARYRKGGVTVRVGAKDKETGKMELQIFNVFGFTALAGTRGFLQSLESRCIIFYMQKSLRKLPVFIDETEAKSLKAKLFMLQYEWANHRTGDDFDGFDDFSGVPLSGRSIELLVPLLTVAPPEARDRIRAFALDLEERKSDEIGSSDDALVYLSLRAVHETTGEDEIPLLVLRDRVNESLPDKEGLKLQTIGYILKRLGVRTKRGHAGRRFAVYNEKLIARLAPMFGETAEKPSKSSNPSPETKGDDLRAFSQEGDDFGGRFEKSSKPSP